MNYNDEIITAIELHDASKIRECFRNGVDANGMFRGEPLINELTSEYTRTARFRDCVQAFVDHGLAFADKTLLAVLLNDHSTLNRLLLSDPTLVSKNYSLRCAYTPLIEVTLLHICAEFNHVACAEILVRHGADINAKAGWDEHGFGGHTAVFHTVNQNSDNSAAMLDFLLAEKTDLSATVIGLIWGKGYSWETFIPAVNPISYAMMGLLPQMHRDEKTIASTVSTLMEHAYGIHYVPENIPCAYLRS